MRILFAGDTHGDSTHVRYLVGRAKASSCDRVFVLGDFGHWPHMADGRRFLEQLNNLATKEQVPIYFLDGNHDNMPPIYRTPQPADRYGFLHPTVVEGDKETVMTNIHYAPRGHQWIWGSKRFIALGGAYSVDKDYRLKEEARRGRSNYLWFETEEMTDGDMENILRTASPRVVDVMLAHDKPLRSQPDWNRKDLPECLPNQRRLQRAIDHLAPEHYFHGHLHYFYTDTVQIGGTGKPCNVVGLDCNAEAAQSPNYDRTKSWLVFDTGASEAAEVDEKIAA